jgi:hypothetical protein
MADANKPKTGGSSQTDGNGKVPDRTFHHKILLCVVTWCVLMIFAFIPIDLPDPILAKYISAGKTFTVVPTTWIMFYHLKKILNHHDAPSYAANIMAIMAGYMKRLPVALLRWIMERQYDHTNGSDENPATGTASSEKNQLKVASKNLSSENNDIDKKGIE